MVVGVGGIVDDVLTEAKIEDIVRRVVEESQSKRPAEMSEAIREYMARRLSPDLAVGVGVVQLQATIIETVRKAVSILRTRVNVCTVLLYTLSIQSIVTNLNRMGFSWADRSRVVMFLSITALTIVTTGLVQFWTFLLRLKHPIVNRRYPASDSS